MSRPQKYNFKPLGRYVEPRRPLTMEDIIVIRKLEKLRPPGPKEYQLVYRFGDGRPKSRYIKPYKPDRTIKTDSVEYEKENIERLRKLFEDAARQALLKKEEPLPAKKETSVYEELNKDMFAMHDEFPSYRNFMDAEAGVLEYGGSIGCLLLMIIFPIGIFYKMLCGLNKCIVTDVNDLMELILQPDKIIFSIKIIGQLFILQMIIHGMGIYGVVNKNEYDNKIISCFNGMFAIAVTFIYLLLSEFLQLINISDIMDAYHGMAFVSYVAAIMLTLCLHFKNHNKRHKLLNLNANSSSNINNFWRGKEILPYVPNINVRMVINRYCMVGTIMLLLIYIKSAIFWKSCPAGRNSYELFSGIFIQPTIIIIAIMQICYIGYDLRYEKERNNSYEWNYEGVGYMEIVTCFMYPFYFTSITKLAFEHDIMIWYPIMIFILAIYISGFILKIQYSNSKPDLRINPLHPELPDRTLAKYITGKLIIDPKSVRFPTYWGDMIIQISFAFTGFVMLTLEVFTPMFTIACIAHRAWRIDRKCVINYRILWAMYSIKHPKILFPERW